jgi:hypothetical protein
MCLRVETVLLSLVVVRCVVECVLDACMYTYAHGTHMCVRTVDVMSVCIRGLAATPGVHTMPKQFYQKKLLTIATTNTILYVMLCYGGFQAAQ